MGAYVVKEGDNLSKIGKELFGDPEFWRGEEFRAANPDLDVNRLSIGQRIELPDFEAPEVDIPDPRIRPDVEAEGIPDPRIRPTTKVAGRPEIEGAEPGYMPLDEFLANMKHMEGIGKPNPEDAGWGNYFQTTRDMNLKSREMEASRGSDWVTDPITNADEAIPETPLVKRGMEPRTADVGLGGARPNPTQLTDEQLGTLTDRRGDIEKIMRMWTSEPNLIDEILESYGLLGGEPEI